MIPDSLKLPIIDFVSSAKNIQNLECIVLFGSVVTGDMSKKSDIDMLLIFDTNHNPEVGKEAKDIHSIASAVSTKYDIKHPFSFVFVNKKNIEEIDPDFLWNVANNGVVIYGKPKDIIMKTPHPSLEPLMLIYYSVKGLNEKDKRKLLRKLYTSKKRIIDRKRERIGPGVLLVKTEKIEKIKKTFDEFNVRYSIKRLWGH